MTARDLADRLGARPTGAGRWQGKCPAHPDRTPSLSIREGAGDRVLIRCWSGCDTSAVLAAANISWRDVCGAPTSAVDRARLAREGGRRQVAEAAERRRERKRTNLLRESDGTLEQLARKLTLEPGGGGETYHALLGARRIAEGGDPWA
ncbi:MAG: hypothetical protein ACRD1Y_01640 [Terriglobales bacterium]